jgi:beta-lactamase class D
MPIALEPYFHKSTPVGQIEFTPTFGFESTETMNKKNAILLFLLLITWKAQAQIDLVTPFKACGIEGSITVYDYGDKKWLMSDSADTQRITLPASTFKVINLLVALETKVIADENEVVKWVGKTDTTLYGYRPDIYHDMTVKEAFEQSAGWVFIELAKRIGRDRYQDLLAKAHYGNGQLTEPGPDFWNFGAFGISPANQVQFLISVYEGKTPFSRRSVEILKRVMVSEVKEGYTIRSKTGWTRYQNKDTGWWVGYVETKGNVYFFATRLIKNRQVPNPDFGACRQRITRDVLRQLGAIP